MVALKLGRTGVAWEMEDNRQDALLEGLRAVGLNRYEASVSLGLVADQTAKVAEISRRTGVPQPKVYRALDALVDKGFCSVGQDAVNRYRPTPPSVALEAHILALRKDEDHARELGGVLEALLVEGQGQALWAPPIEIVKGLRQVRRLLVERIDAATEEVLQFGKAPPSLALDITQALARKGEAGCALRFVFEPEYPRSGEGARRRRRWCSIVR